MMQWSVLGFVADAGTTGIRITSLAKVVDTTQAFITNTINTLESKGYVQRTVDASDSRARMVSLKPGKAKIVQAVEIEVRTAMRQEIYSKVTPEELKVYVNVLAKFAGK